MSPQLLIGVATSLALASLAWINLSLVPQLRGQAETTQVAEPPVPGAPPCSACPECPNAPLADHIPSSEGDRNVKASAAPVNLTNLHTPTLSEGAGETPQVDPATTVHSAKPSPVLVPSPAAPGMAIATAHAQVRHQLAAQVFFGEKLSTRLDNTARKTLKSLASQLDLSGDDRLILRAHADRRGRARFNRRLARRRAESVRRFLKQRGIRRSRMAIESIGERDAIGLPEAQFRSLRQDRRVDIVLVQGD